MHLDSSYVHVTLTNVSLKLKTAFFKALEKQNLVSRKTEQLKLKPVRSITCRSSN